MFGGSFLYYNERIYILWADIQAVITVHQVIIVVHTIVHQAVIHQAAQAVRRIITAGAEQARIGTEHRATDITLIMRYLLLQSDTAERGMTE